MTLEIALLLVSLGIILLGAEVFTNAVEWLGLRLKLSEGAVGSILAAVGTALPETMIPIIAFLTSDAKEAHGVGIGAILGAPLMLSTLAMFITGLAVFLNASRRRSGTAVVADESVMIRDLGFFLIVFTAAILNGIIPTRRWQMIIAGFMVFSYLWYVFDTLREERGESEEDLRPLYFMPSSLNPSVVLICIQLVVALALIIGGAKLFVKETTEIATAVGVPAFVLALVIAPVATELPEKFNSVIWVSRGKDTLALGNITGAMVFQSSLIPAIGVFMTDWRLGIGGFLTGVIALLAGAIVYLEVKKRKSIRATTLLACGGLYVFFFIMVLEGVIR